MAYSTIKVDRSDGLARVTLDRPDHRNGMTYRMVEELHEAFTGLAADSSLRVVVVTGAGKTFCPGADIGWATGTGGDPADSEPIDPACFHLTAVLHDMPAVTVAAINGACAGAGMSLACAADLRLAVSTARFSTAFINVAFAGDLGLPWSLQRLVGGAKARELSLLCDKFDAGEALRIGLVSRVFEPDDFATETEAVVAGLMRRSPVALRTLKAHYHVATRTTFTDFLTLETEHHESIGRLRDTREALRAFMEKREPVFRGE